LQGLWELVWAVGACVVPIGVKRLAARFFLSIALAAPLSAEVQQLVAPRDLSRLSIEELAQVKITSVSG
jgi:hypothetical protein